MAAAGNASLHFDAEQTASLFDLWRYNTKDGVAISHRQIWFDTPVSIEAKVHWARSEGLAGVGFWTADAVASVPEYYWGGGCNGNKSQELCVQDDAQTEVGPWNVRYSAPLT